MATVRLSNESIIAIVTLFTMITIAPAGWLVTQHLARRNRFHDHYSTQQHDFERERRMLARLVGAWAGSTSSSMATLDDMVDVHEDGNDGGSGVELDRMRASEEV
ncbi:hypothetical protein KVT40_008790 [Elsinoe batatas]|uniref:Uncharacterized protein n=1 Tax=Elsinoe batatas TaxID=2601811 RepID=A0A8K0KW28_9PEZI|nr:hypothetical protein KVT40_008790 [Elsinoe batatas]